MKLSSARKRHSLLSTYPVHLRGTARGLGIHFPSKSRRTSAPCQACSWLLMRLTDGTQAFGPSLEEVKPEPPGAVAV